MASYTCNKCRKTMDEVNFYTYKDGSKTEMCKKCLTLHIDNFNPETYLWLLEKMDVPYIPEEWNILLDRAYAKNPNKINGMSVFGKYLSKMKLKQFKDFGWADTERLKQEKEQRLQEEEEQRKNMEAAVKQRYEAGEIGESEYRTLTSTPTQLAEDSVAHIVNTTQELNKDNPFNENNFVKEEDLPNLAAELTEEDKTYLLMKWGRLYTPNEWIELEKMYNEMMHSFDIQDADTINTLLLICKTNLKMNQALDSGDIEGFQKLSRVSDQLRKSAKFTAAQSKEQKEDFVDCIGTMVAYCEEKGGQIPKFEHEYNLDLVDKVINDMKDYTRSLIYEDKALARQIEDYLKKREIAEQQKKDQKQAKEQGLNEVVLEDDDYKKYYEAIDSQKETDKQTLKNAGDEIIS